VYVGFFALALSVSALPVVAKILQDLGFLRRNFGQITLAAGMTMDAIGWLLLAALSGIALDGFDPGRLAFSFGGLAIFLVLVVTVGRWMLDSVMRWVLDRGSNTAAALTISLVAALVGGLITQALRLEAILGAFIVGILLATLRHQLPQVQSVLETSTAAIFAPVFFAFSGLRVDIGLLTEPGPLAWTIGLTVAAVAAKVVGTILGGSRAGIRGREALALGSGLAALGAMGIVVAIVGLNLGVLSETGYTVVVVVAILTSLISPQLLKTAVRGWTTPLEEQARLDREELLEASEILGSRRVLLPTRGGRNSRYAARLVMSVLDEVDVTVLAVDVPESWWQRFVRGVGPGTSDPSDVLEELAGTKHRLIRKVASNPAAAIGRESRLGYDLVVVGASEEERDGGRIFSNVVDRTLAEVDIPTVVVRFPSGDGETLPPLPRRVLVPIVGSRASRAAEEMGFSLARRSAGEAVVLHVVNLPQGQEIMIESTVTQAALRTGQEMVSAGAALGERLGVSVDTAVRQSPNPEAEILGYSEHGNFDLMVIGAANRAVTDSPFFGHRVSYMIERSAIPVVVVALPAPRRRPAGETNQGSGKGEPEP
jgi:Kef-type K+ transport system membrane component KefB/nucleotide-binding universal stress UspA family protein